MKPRLSLPAKLHEPSRERSIREESWWGGLSSIMCHGTQNKVCCRWTWPCCLERVRAESGEPAGKTLQNQLQKQKPAELLSRAFSSRPACSTGKTTSPAWGLGAGWATFWSVFIQIPFLPSPGGGGGSHTGEGEGEAEVFICPPLSQAKKNSPLPRSFISVIYSRRCFLQYKQEAKNVGEERRAGGEGRVNRQL